MPAYISFINLTDQGIRTVKEDVHRVRAAAHAGEHKGIRIINEWWTLGQYDAVMVFEAPDDETASQFLLAGGIRGNIRTTTVRAFSQEEMQRIVRAIP